LGDFEKGMVAPMDVLVPLATYTGWNVRRKEAGAEGDLATLLGSCIPYARTKAERLKTQDSRYSIEERFGSFEKYRELYAQECQRQVRDRFLLEADVEPLLKNLEARRKLFPGAQCK
jgi:hypothetical protein